MAEFWKGNCDSYHVKDGGTKLKRILNIMGIRN
jgi:hypothetical protein